MGPRLRSNSSSSSIFSVDDIVTRQEESYALLYPAFRAVQDTWLEYRTPDGPLDELKKVKLVVDDAAHDTARHYAFCMESGRSIHLSPRMAHELPEETVMGILNHEFGHASDFLYPGRFVTALRPGKPAKWIDDDLVGLKDALRWQKVWLTRSIDQVEWAADSIAQLATGMEIKYCGSRILQCYSGTKRRPEGLR